MTTLYHPAGRKGRTRPKEEPSFFFSRYTIRGFLPRKRHKVVFEATYPRFRDQHDLRIYRKVYLERITKKPTSYDVAVLDLLDALEQELFDTDLI